MVDKLDVRLDAYQPFRPEFQAVLDEVRAHPREFGFHPSEHYHVTGSLQPFGIDAIFHGWNKHTKAGEAQTHKLELLDVGDRTFRGALADCERIIDSDPLRLGVMRLDLTANIPNVPVSFFREHMRVRFKRRGAYATDFLHIYQGEGETVYFGARPNNYRVYNKVAELQRQYEKAIRPLVREANLKEFHAQFSQEYILDELEKAQRYANPDAELPTLAEVTARLRRSVRVSRRDAGIPDFAQMFGVREDEVLTRVERSIGGGRVPKQLDTVARLVDRLPDFDPFDNVEILAGRDQLPQREQFTFAQYEAGLRLREMQERDGLDYVRRYIKLHASTPAREWETYAPFFSLGEAQLTEGQLFDFYRDSVVRQLAA